ncbi:polysaccharide deacetylase family protein [Bacillus sp. V3B]|uniref:polysaccharide deacetylase family protein n=1 Tax=Bacillus sp. V3B TaxID=2804915 RepID=UPI00210C11D3|nr:polysaccharide deacetylase family protein [Bacillus sp. V3B]MCQ6275593.1 polysaccharide deacetylase family protein [Bacillus sp. V3B]
MFLIVGFAGANQWIGKGSRVVSTIENEVLSVVPGFNLETRKKKTNSYSFSISTLLTESEPINQAIQTWIKTEEDQFLADVEKKETKAFHEDHRAKLHIHVNMNKVTNDLYSVTLDLEKRFDEAKRKNVIKTFNMDLIENKILFLADVLDIDGDNWDEICSIIKEQLETEEESRQGMDEWLDQALNHPDQLDWLITQNVLTFYFNDVSSPIKVDIPVENVGSYLKENIIQRLNIKIVEKEVVVLDPNGKYIALTFDDGPSPSVTPRILKTLKEYHAKATFFMLGSQVEYHPLLAKRVADEGHEIGNHTRSHSVLNKLTEEEIRREIEGTSQTIEEVIGQLPTSIRPPYGIYNEIVEKVAFENDFPIILWSVDSLDWKNRNAKAVNNLILDGVFPGSIVLLHDIHPTTADALPALMRALKNEGYQFITVSELLTLQETKETGPYYGIAY